MVLLQDDMKKEGKGFVYAFTVCLILFLLTVVQIFLTKRKHVFGNTDIAKLIVFGFFTLLSLYGWLYALKYRLEITEEKISLKTLFKRVEILITDISCYTCKRYGKSVFYQFMLRAKNRKVLISTRHPEIVVNILEDKKPQP